MKQTASSLQMQQERTGHNSHVLIYQSNQQFSTIVSMNRQSGGLSFLVLAKDRNKAAK